jgi:hypothetical protein
MLLVGDQHLAVVCIARRLIEGPDGRLTGLAAANQRAG